MPSDETPMTTQPTCEDGHGLGLSAVATRDDGSSAPDNTGWTATGMETLPQRVDSLSLSVDPPPAPALTPTPSGAPTASSAAYAHSAYPRSSIPDDGPAVSPAEAQAATWDLPLPSPIPDVPKSAPVSPRPQSSAESARHHRGRHLLQPLHQLRPVPPASGAITPVAHQRASPPWERNSPRPAPPAESDAEEDDVLSAIGSTPSRSTVSHTAGDSPAGSRSSRPTSVKRPLGSTTSDADVPSAVAKAAIVGGNTSEESLTFERPPMPSRFHTDPTGLLPLRRTSSGHVSFASGGSGPPTHSSENSSERARSPHRRSIALPHVRVPVLLGTIGRRKSTSPSGVSEHGQPGHHRFTSLLAAIASGHSRQRSSVPKAPSSSGESGSLAPNSPSSRSRSSQRDPSPRELKEAVRHAPKLKLAYGVPYGSDDDRSPRFEAIPYAMSKDAKAAKLLGVAAEDNACFSPHYTIEDISHLPRFPAQQEHILDLSLMMSDLHKYTFTASTMLRSGKATFKRRTIALTRTGVPTEVGTMTRHAYTLHAFRTTNLAEPESARLRLSATTVVCVPSDADYVNIGEGTTRLPYALYVSGTGSFRAGIGLDQYEKKTSWILGMQDVETFSSWLDMLKEVVREVRASASYRLPAAIAAGKATLSDASRRTMDAGIVQLDAQLQSQPRRGSLASSVSGDGSSCQSTEKSNAAVTRAAQAAEDKQTAERAMEETRAAVTASVTSTAPDDEEPVDPAMPRRASQSRSPRLAGSGLHTASSELHQVASTTRPQLKRNSSAYTPLDKGKHAETNVRNLPPRAPAPVSALPPTPGAFPPTPSILPSGYMWPSKSSPSSGSSLSRPSLTSHRSADSNATDCSLPSLTSTATASGSSNRLSDSCSGYFDFGFPPNPTPAPKSPLKNVHPLFSDPDDVKDLLE
ncbi:hypothetical protein JCM10908_006762 [Rhodotorula pacifica]|uniref:uncharacterized protein n=1 Tax=Rhodotorula pacifica TaxID=1495444 RepID=UPI00317D2EA1